MVSRWVNESNSIIVYCSDRNLEYGLKWMTALLSIFAIVMVFVIFFCCCWSARRRKVNVILGWFISSVLQERLYGERQMRQRVPIVPATYKSTTSIQTYQAEPLRPKKSVHINGSNSTEQYSSASSSSRHESSPPPLFENYTDDEPPVRRYRLETSA